MLFGNAESSKEHLLLSEIIAAARRPLKFRLDDRLHEDETHAVIAPGE